MSVANNKFLYFLIFFLSSYIINAQVLSPRSKPYSAVVNDGIIVFGGSAESVERDLLDGAIYNPKTKLWTKVPDLKIQENERLFGGYLMASTLFHGGFGYGDYFALVSYIRQDKSVKNYLNILDTKRYKWLKFEFPKWYEHYYVSINVDEKIIFVGLEQNGENARGVRFVYFCLNTLKWKESEVVIPKELKEVAVRPRESFQYQGKLYYKPEYGNYERFVEVDFNTNTLREINIKKAPFFNLETSNNLVDSDFVSSDSMIYFTDMRRILHGTDIANRKSVEISSTERLERQFSRIFIFATRAVYEDKLFVWGGLNLETKERFNDGWMFDPQTKEWEYIPSKPIKDIPRFNPETLKNDVAKINKFMVSPYSTYFTHMQQIFTESQEVSETDQITTDRFFWLIHEPFIRDYNTLNFRELYKKYEIQLEDLKSHHGISRIEDIKLNKNILRMIVTIVQNSLKSCSPYFDIDTQNTITDIQLQLAKLDIESIPEKNNSQKLISILESEDSKNILRAFNTKGFDQFNKTIESALRYLKHTGQP